jgi:hypothetical protein
VSTRAKDKWCRVMVFHRQDMTAQKVFAQLSISLALRQPVLLAWYSLSWLPFSIPKNYFCATRRVEWVRIASEGQVWQDGYPKEKLLYGRPSFDGDARTGEAIYARTRSGVCFENRPLVLAQHFKAHAHPACFFSQYAINAQAILGRHCGEAKNAL